MVNMFWWNQNSNSITQKIGKKMKTRMKSCKNIGFWFAITIRMFVEDVCTNFIEFKGARLFFCLHNSIIRMFKLHTDLHAISEKNPNYLLVVFFCLSVYWFCYWFSHIFDRFGVARVVPMWFQYSIQLYQLTVISGTHC